MLTGFKVTKALRRKCISPHYVHDKYSVHHIGEPDLVWLSETEIIGEVAYICRKSSFDSIPCLSSSRSIPSFPDGLEDSDAPPAAVEVVGKAVHGMEPDEEPQEKAAKAQGGVQSSMAPVNLVLPFVQGKQLGTLDPQQQTAAVPDVMSLLFQLVLGGKMPPSCKNMIPDEGLARRGSGAASSDASVDVLLSPAGDEVGDDSPNTARKSIADDLLLLAHWDRIANAAEHKTRSMGLLSEAEFKACIANDKDPDTKRPNLLPPTEERDDAERDRAKLIDHALRECLNDANAETMQLEAFLVSLEKPETTYGVKALQTFFGNLGQDDKKRIMLKMPKSSMKTIIAGLDGEQWGRVFKQELLAQLYAAEW
jgi:hypothetical protein